MIKAIIFDFDGTIIDTETAWYDAFKEAYKNYDVDLTFEQYSQCIGTSLHSFNPYEYLKTHLNLPIDLAEFRTAVRQRHAELMKQEKIRPGILAYLEQAKQAGLRIGLATSSEQSWIDQHLDHLQIRSYFEVIRTADHVKKVKPDPELYIQALDGLGVQAHEAVAIEDSPNGARAAEAAGIPTVVCKNTITRLLTFDTSHYEVQCLEDLSFNELMSLPLVKSNS